MTLHDRADDLTAIRSAMARARTGAAVLVAVTGAPGTGRSAFLDAVGALAAGEGFVVRRAGGSRLEQGLRLGLTGRLLARPTEPDGPTPHAAAVVDALVAAERATAAPVTLLVDDLQWADAASLDWLTRLLADPRPAPLLLVLAVCEGEFAAELPGVQDLLSAADPVVRMTPLTPPGVRALLRERGIAVTDATARAWAEATGGNPALIDSLLDRVDVPQRHAPTRLLGTALARPAPWSLRGRVAAALSSHPESVQRLAYSAALLGGTAGTRTLARLADLDPAEEAAAVRALHRLGWAPDRCRPPVLWACLREIAEAGLDLDDRTELHRRTAELLYATGAPVERVAPHLLEVGPGEWPEAARVLREAADDARRRGETALAIRFLRRALRECPPDSARRGEFLAALAEAEQDADTAAMLRHVTQALPLLPSAHERAAVVANVPVTLFVAAPPAAAEAIATARATLAAVPAADPETIELTRRLEARERLYALTAPDAAEAAVRRLRELAPGPGPGTAAQRELVSVLAFTATYGGRLPAAEVAALVRWTLEHEPASAASGYAATSLMIAAGTAAEVGEPVRSWLDIALDAARQRGDERQRTRMLGWRALSALHAGRLADAWSDARDACAVSPAMLGDNDWLSALALTAVAAETRDPWLAGRLGGLLGERADHAVAWRAAPLVLRACLDPDSAQPGLVTGLLDTLRHAEATGWYNHTLFPMGLWCVPLLLRHGETETALELLARACDRARAFGSPTALGRVLRVWGTVVRGRYALSLLAESVAVLRESPNTLELGRALTAYGTRLRRAGRPGAAELLAEADRIADATGASLLRCWTEAPSGELGQVVPPGSARFSDSERRVAALVALGHTNQDAADTLGVTRRAVEKTLTGLYRRLGVNGRTGLIPVVRRLAGEAAFRSGVLCEKL